MRRFSAKFCLLVLAICSVAWFGSLSAFAETPSNGVPNPNSYDPISPGVPSLEHTVLFGNKAVQSALTSVPLTAASLTDSATDPASPLYPFWFDSNSVVLMTYIWSNAHRAGDDLV